MANKLSVAFIGTGIMGAPIAGHILDAGYPVTVNNRTKSKAAALIERGAVWADTPADAAANPAPRAHKPLRRHGLSMPYFSFAQSLRPQG